MSRPLSFTGAQFTPADPALWTFQTKVVQFASTNLSIQLYKPPGPMLAEFFLIEADVQNADYVLIGEKDAKVIAGPPVSNQTIITLGPGDWVLWEPNEQTKPYQGILTLPDGTLTQFFMQQNNDVLDITQFYGVSGPTFSPTSIHCTIGTRNQRFL